MRICLISREYPPETGWGGIGTYTHQHAQALKLAGHDVEVVSLTDDSANSDSEGHSSLPDSGEQVPVHRAAWGHLFEELSTLWMSVPNAYFALRSSSGMWRRFIELHRRKPFDVIEAPEHLADTAGFAQPGDPHRAKSIHSRHRLAI